MMKANINDRSPNQKKGEEKMDPKKFRTSQKPAILGLFSNKALFLKQNW